MAVEPDPDGALQDLYDDFEAAGLLPLWTQRGDLMPETPQPAARPYRWIWKDVLPLAERAGTLVAVGRGGERRAIALSNPGLPGLPFATPTLWAAVQYLGPGETAPAHRHSQGAFRFVLEGEGVWTIVDGDPVSMRRGDLLLTPAWCWHEHHNSSAQPMMWLDGLDIPLVGALDAEFFEYGNDDIGDRSTPDISRSEALWGHPGLRPLGAPDTPHSPLAAYRWEHTDAALNAQLELELAGCPSVLAPGHAGVRFTNPTTGRDALPTMRLEMHRLRPGVATVRGRDVGSSVWQVFAGEALFQCDDRAFEVARGDIVAIPSWCSWEIRASSALDVFVFRDAPVYEALNLALSVVS